MNNTATQPSFEIRLNSKQYEIHNAREKEIFYISGIGGGKSFELGQWMLERASVVGSIALLAAPTHDVIRQSTLPQVMESWAKVGIINGQHYVINEKPPQEWGVEAFSELGNQRIITFGWGSYIVLDTLENVNKARGSEYDYIGVDEFRDTRFSEVRKVLLGRLRGRKFKELNKACQILWVSTPPDNPTELNELLESNKTSLRLVEGTSFDNLENLPPNYIQDLEKTYDPATAQREIYGKRISVGSLKPFMYCFDDTRHLSEDVIYNPKFPVYLSFDFNVNPMTCVVVQHGFQDAKPFIYFIDEIHLQNSDIYEVCQRIRTSDYYNAHFQVTGDRSGLNRSGLKKNMNYYVAIKQELNLKDSQFTLPVNPHFNESLVLCNSLLARHPNIKFHSVRCKQTIYDMRFVEWDGVKPIKEDRSKREQQADLFDGTRYYFNAFHHDFVKRY